MGNMGNLSNFPSQSHDSDQYFSCINFTIRLDSLEIIFANGVVKFFISVQNMKYVGKFDVSTYIICQTQLSRKFDSEHRMNLQALSMNGFELLVLKIQKNTYLKKSPE